MAKKIKVKKVRAKFGSSLSERIFRDSLKSIAKVFEVFYNILSGEKKEVKVDQQFKIKTDEGISKILDFRIKIGDIITFIEFDSRKQHSLLKAKKKDSAIDRTIKKYKLRLIRVYQKTFIRYRYRILTVIFLLCTIKDQDGVLFIRNINDLKRVEKFVRQYYKMKK